MNLLSNQLLPVWNGSVRELVSLPGLFTAWGAGNDLELAGLKAHQQPVVECALAQFAAHALEVAGIDAFNLSERQWHDALQSLADAEGAPYFWDLVLDDSSQAAFCQPALTADALLKKTSSDVLAFDTLVASKNHDVKLDGHTQPSVADWVYALLTLQTTCGYDGLTLYGIARMNQGAGSRVFFAAYNDPTQAGRWREDVTRLRMHWAQVLEGGVFGYSANGIRLLAAAPWDGRTSIPLKRLHPGFVEVARPMRLVMRDGRLAARHGGTKVERIEGVDTLLGNVGDPWTPIVREQPVPAGKSSPKGNVRKALSPGDGFSWRTFVDLVLDAPAYDINKLFSRPLEPGKPVTLRLVALCRGRGKTNGLTDFRFTVSRKAAPTFFGSADRDSRTQLLALKQRAVEVAEKVIARTEWAYLRAHTELDDKVDAKALRKKPLHQKNLGSLRSTAVSGWQERLLPWLCECAEDGRVNEDSLEGWMQERTEFAHRLLTNLLMPQPGTTRATTLRLAQALAALPHNLSALK